jgi:hypothetical protein
MILQSFMELAGREPATSRARSSQLRNVPGRMVSAIDGVLLALPNIFPNTLQLVLH